MKKIINQIIKIFTGMLTVDPKERLTMRDLKCNEWLRGGSAAQMPETPLMTPNVLCSKGPSLQFQINATMDAFHKAHREGFRLQDVQKAPLAQRRKMKKSSTDARSSSSDSCTSAGSLTPTKSLSQSPIRQSPIRNLSNNSSTSSAASTGFTPLKNFNSKPSVLENSGYFSFRETRIAALLPTMSPIAVSDASSTESNERTSTSNNNNNNVNEFFLHGNNNESTPVRGTKRKLDVVIEDDSDDDDCIIVGEESNSSSNSSISNLSAAKRPRMKTIVID